MKKTRLSRHFAARTLLLPALLLPLLCGCTNRQLAGVSVGGSFGAIFGSSIGGLMGGPRGADAGTAIGLATGAAIGAAVTQERSERPARADNSRKRRTDTYDDDLYADYASAKPARQHTPQGSTASAPSRWSYLEVSNVRFLDSNGNRCLDSGEHAWVVMDIHNRGSRTLRDVAPVVACESRRVAVSPTAIVSELAPGAGIRYKAAVLAYRKLRDGSLRFTVSFGQGPERVVAKTFLVDTRR